MNSNDKIEWLNKKQCAELLGVSYPTIDRWMRDDLPYYKFGAINSAVKFNKKEILDYIEKCKK